MSEGRNVGPWRIPESWSWSPIGHVTTVVGGGTPSTTEPKFWDGGTVPWLTPADLSGYTAMRIRSGSRFITTDGLGASGAKMLPTGTVLMSSRAPVGYVAIAAQPLSTNQGFKSFMPTPALLPEYLYYFVLGNRRLLFDRSSGTTFQEISGRAAATVPVPIAPINEQRRVVAAIEEHLSRLEAAAAALKRVRALIPRYRAGVLSAAYNGVLWVNRSGSGADAGDVAWPLRPLSELLREPLRNGHSAKKSTSSTGVRTLTLTAVTRGDFGEHNTKITVADPARVEDLWLEHDDILIERSNTPELVGTAARYVGPSRWAIFPDLLIRARVSPSILPRFIEIVLQSEPVRRFFRSRAQGIAGTMPKIDQTTVGMVPIPVPRIEAQSAICEEVDRRLSLLADAEAATVAAIARAASLRQSILKRAFEGRLVAQDPHDESVSVLLDRIRASRATESAAPKKSRSSS